MVVFYQTCNWFMDLPDPNNAQAGFVSVVVGAGAAWFESMLIDYDVTSNYGNWIYAAGVGNDPRDRVFNTKRQADMYDKDGAFRNLWLKHANVKS